MPTRQPSAATLRQSWYQVSDDAGPEVPEFVDGKPGDRRFETGTLTLLLSQRDFESLVADPSGFVRTVLERAGRTVNGVTVRCQLPNPPKARGWRFYGKARWFHCCWPEEKRSVWELIEMDIAEFLLPLD